jgi:hypothetical protein
MDPDHLRNIPVFADLGDDELAHIAALAAEVSVPDGKELVREGDYSYDVLAIEEGTARVERHGERIADLGPATSSARWASSSAPSATRPSAPRRRCGSSR